MQHSLGSSVLHPRTTPKFGRHSTAPACTADSRCGQVHWSPAAAARWQPTSTSEASSAPLHGRAKRHRCHCSAPPAMAEPYAEEDEAEQESRPALGGWRAQLEQDVSIAAMQRAVDMQYSQAFDDDNSLAPALPSAAAKWRQSSWDAKETGGGRGGGADYLFELGKSQQYNINVDHGQNIDHIDYLFAGELLGQKSDIANGSLRHYEMRTYNNIVGDYYVAPAFLEQIAMHVCKNYLVEMGSLTIKVPLILGVWGEKGMGKTFQTELALKKLGCEAVVMSSGELEDEWAGTPGKLIRQRYRRASEMSKVHGKLTCLVIHDIDAGLGHFDNTQITVNNQICVGTLMNICDDPKRVSTGQDWRQEDIIRRIPIIATGNDFSTLFAPLVRDGRMLKYMWKPEQEDLVAILFQMYKDDGLRWQDMEALLDRFKAQPLDFFGALRASTYDNQIRAWIKDEVVGCDITEQNANLSELSKRLIGRENLPKFKPVKFTMDMLMVEGERLEREAQLVKDFNLAKDYLKSFGKKVKGRRPGIGLAG